jgi:hypothetical protein
MSDPYEVIEKLELSADPADKIVAAIWRDVMGRRGWRQEGDRFDDAIMCEVIDEWGKLARAHLS